MLIKQDGLAIDKIWTIRTHLIPTGQFSAHLFSDFPIFTFDILFSNQNINCLFENIHLFFSESHF